MRFVKRMHQPMRFDCLNSNMFATYSIIDSSNLCECNIWMRFQQQINWFFQRKVAFPRINGVHCMYCVTIWIFSAQFKSEWHFIDWSLSLSLSHSQDAIVRTECNRNCDKIVLGTIPNGNPESVLFVSNIFGAFVGIRWLLLLCWLCISFVCHFYLLFVAWNESSKFTAYIPTDNMTKWPKLYPFSSAFLRYSSSKVLRYTIWLKT